MSDLELRGIDGSNLLSFLAALGAFSALRRAWPSRRMRLSWRHRGCWRPVLHIEVDPDERPNASMDHAVVQAISDALPRRANAPEFNIMDEAGELVGDTASCAPEAFRAFAREAGRTASAANRVAADFAAAFGCEGLTTDKGSIQDTAFRTMSGAGHQHFLGMMRALFSDTTRAHVEKALFTRWKYDDPVRNHTMRWDPRDEARYALRANDPSGDPSRQTTGAVWGANCLAVEALALFPTAPVGRRLETTGFSHRGGAVEFSWPIWQPAISAATLRSLLSLPSLTERDPPAAALRAAGVVEVFRARRFTEGRFRNFSPAWACLGGA